VRRPLRDDLARLDVPHDNLVVLGAAHEVRAVGRQDRRDAVPAGGRAGQPLEGSGASRAEQGGGRRRRRERDALAVLVPLVRLDDLVVLVVPQPHGRVERAREEEFRVGREAHARDGRVVLVRERLEALARRGVPDAAVRAREGGRKEEGRGEGETSQDRASGQRRTGREDTHVAVPRAGHEHSAVAAELDGADRLRVRGEDPHAPACARTSGPISPASPQQGRGELNREGREATHLSGRPTRAPSRRRRRSRPSRPSGSTRRRTRP